jgi:predicted transcriptional regulator
MEKKSKTKEEQPMVAKEPMVEYGVNNEVQEYDIPNELFKKVIRSAMDDIANGRVYTTQEVMTQLDQRMGWI